MKQLLVIIMQYIYLAVCDNIDRAFINNTNLDAICILGTYLTISTISNKIASVGRYAYRVNRKNVSECLLLTFIVSTLISITLFFFGNQIISIYTLTDAQFTALSNALKILSVGFIVQSLGDFLYEYILLNEKYKLNVTSTTLYYACMFTFDLIIFMTSKRFELFLLLTLVSYLIYDIYIMIKINIHKELNKPSVKIIKKYAKDGIHLATTTFLVEFAGIIYTSYASKLGTQLYALHSVCYSVLAMVAYINNAYSVYALTVLKKHKKEDRFIELKKLILKNGWLSAVIALVAFFPLIFILKGDVELGMCIKFAPFYLISFIPVLLTTLFHGYLTVEKLTIHLTISGFLGLITRIISVFVLFNYFNNLLPFIISILLDALVQMFYASFIAYKHNKTYADTKINYAYENVY